MDAAILRTFLECPICFLVPRTEIFSCINSHKICKSCYGKLPGEDGTKQCPHGGCDFDKPPRRARDFEAMIDKSDCKLICSKPGCIQEMKKSEIKDHEAECVFRLVPCPKLSCKKMILFKNIVSHIKRNHKNRIQHLHESAIRPHLKDKILKAKNWKWVLFTYKEKEVQFYPQFVKRNDLWFFWIMV